MNVFLTILYFVAMAVVLIGSLVLLKKYVFSKIRINKYIPLGIAVVGFLYQLLLGSTNVIVSIVMTMLIVLFFSWFWDINQTGGPKKDNQKKIVIKAKAKPNRVKKDN